MIDRAEYNRRLTAALKRVDADPQMALRLYEDLASIKEAERRGVDGRKAWSAVADALVYGKYGNVQ
jgi:hypothetical protein